MSREINPYIEWYGYDNAIVVGNIHCHWHTLALPFGFEAHSEGIAKRAKKVMVVARSLELDSGTNRGPVT